MNECILLFRDVPVCTSDCLKNRTFGFTLELQEIEVLDVSCQLARPVMYILDPQRNVVLTLNRDKCECEQVMGCPIACAKDDDVKIISPRIFIIFNVLFPFISTVIASFDGFGKIFVTLKPLFFTETVPSML